MKLTFLGANRNVTGSRHCLEANGTRLMVDCGLVQERAFLSRNWDPCPIPASEIDVLIVTHAHIDHIGLIPKFVADGFRGLIYATHPTVDLAEVMLKDSAKIQAEDTKYKKRRHRKEGRKGPHPVVPLYTDQDVAKALSQFVGVDYLDPVGVAPGLVVTWYDAGHILGSASVKILAQENGQERTFIFSGDIGQHDKPLIADPTCFQNADYVVMESTYGNRDHENSGSIEQQLESITNQTLGAGGNLVIPVFAVERAQEMMHFFSRLVHENRIPDVPIFLDSPMAYDATIIFRKHESWLDSETKAAIAADEPPLQFPGLKICRTPAESKSINRVSGPCIIMAPAGMCNAGRIKHHLRNNIRDAASTLLFVGYQAEGTLGRRLISGEHRVRIHGKEYNVNARISQILGLSGHADRQGLLAWLNCLEKPPKRLFLTHGEETAALALQAQVEERFGFDVVVPSYGSEHPLDDDGPSCVEAGAVGAVSRTKGPAVDLPPDNVVSSGNLIRGGVDKKGDKNGRETPVNSQTGLRDAWQILRIQSDLVQGIDFLTQTLGKQQTAVSVVGGSRLGPSDPYYQLARQTCRLLGTNGLAIMTGGGPGIMEAANQGARDASALSIGLKVDSPQEREFNAYCDFTYSCQQAFVRKLLFAEFSSGTVIFPGGLGTMDEIFETLTLIQSGELDGRPVVLVGSQFWEPMVAWLRTTVLKQQCIQPSDLELFQIFDEPEEVAGWVKKQVALAKGESS